MARSMLPATTGDVALSLEIQDGTQASNGRSQSSDRPTKFVTAEFARRVLGRRPVLSKPFKRMINALNDAYPEWMLLRDLHSAAGYTPAQFAGLMGAFGRRMSHTDGYDKDVHFFDFRWNDEGDAWEYRLPESVREVFVTTAIRMLAPLIEKWVARWKKSRRLKGQEGDLPPDPDREAVKENPGNGWRVARLITKASSVEEAETLYRDFASQPHKTDEVEVIAAYYVMRALLEGDDEDLWWECLREAEERGYDSDAVFAAASRLEKEFRDDDE